MARVRQLRLNRWLILLALGTALPLLAVAATTFGWLIHDFRADQDRRQADTARALALAVDGEVRSWKAAVTMLAASTALEQGRLADFDEEARRLAAQHDGWVVLTVASGEQLLNTLRPYGSPHAMTSSPETINAIFATGTPVISDVIYGQVTHGYLVAVGVPVRREGKVVNGLTLNFAPDRLTRLLQSQNVPASWIAAVNDRQHHVVARSSKIEERVGKPLVPWLAAAQEAADHGIATGPLVDGRPGQVAFQRLQEAPWTVTLTVPVAELETAWQRPVLVYLVLVALAVLGAVGLAVGLARRIERPVREVAAAAARIVHGLTSVPQPQQSHVTEVAELQTALVNGATVVQMALRSSQEAAGALREANAMLEARVAERTAELTEANAELTQEVHERQRVEADLRDSGAFTGALNA
ncbi:MAG TPA: hypothetical protein VMG58_04565, partial [Candidatus Sulfotelmatobacter sp.]|nr:hypothetical protein [Candidatus Sulfotelmatobacter sp.]